MLFVSREAVSSASFLFKSTPNDGAISLVYPATHLTWSTRKTFWQDDWPWWAAAVDAQAMRLTMLPHCHRQPPNGLLKFKFALSGLLLLMTWTRLPFAISGTPISIWRWAHILAELDSVRGALIALVELRYRVGGMLLMPAEIIRKRLSNPNKIWPNQIMACTSRSAWNKACNAFCHQSAVCQRRNRHGWRAIRCFIIHFYIVHVNKIGILATSFKAACGKPLSYGRSSISASLINGLLSRLRPKTQTWHGSLPQFRSTDFWSQLSSHPSGFIYV